MHGALLRSPSLLAQGDFTLLLGTVQSTPDYTKLASTLLKTWLQKQAPKTPPSLKPSKVASPKKIAPKLVC